MTNPLILLYWAQLQGIEAVATALRDPTDYRFDRRTVGNQDNALGKSRRAVLLPPYHWRAKRGPRHKGAPYATPYRPIPHTGGPTRGGTYTGVPHRRGPMTGVPD